MSTQTSILATLRALRARVVRTPSPQVRIAYKWVRRASAATFDLMFRLSVLEGAAGATPGSWSDNPKRGLAQAQDALSETNVDPSWLSKNDQGFYQFLFNFVDSMLHRSGVGGLVDLAADEILTNSLLGLARSGGSKQRVLYAVGKSLSDKILSGKESPMQVAAGKAKHYLKNKALDEITTVRRRKDIHRIDMGEEEGFSGDRGIKDERLWETTKDKYFTEVLLDPRHPLGKEIRKWARGFLSNLPGGKYLQAWFDMSLQAGRPVPQRDVAQEFGVAPTGLGRYFRPGLKKFQDAFWNTRYADKLEDAFFMSTHGARFATRQAARRLLRREVGSFFQVLP